jgi:hypothetical protein
VNHAIKVHAACGIVRDNSLDKALRVVESRRDLQLRGIIEYLLLACWD